MQQNLKKIAPKLLRSLQYPLNPSPPWRLTSKFAINYNIKLDLRSDLGGTLDSGTEKLKVSGVMQKAVIEVNEKSTEAAATSAITISNRFQLFIFLFFYVSISPGMLFSLFF